MRQLKPDLFILVTDSAWTVKKFREPLVKEIETNNSEAVLIVGPKIAEYSSFAIGTKTSLISCASRYGLKYHLTVFKLLFQIYKAAKLNSQKIVILSFFFPSCIAPSVLNLFMRCDHYVFIEGFGKAKNFRRQSRFNTSRVLLVKLFLSAFSSAFNAVNVLNSDDHNILTAGPLRLAKAKVSQQNTVGVTIDPDRKIRHRKIDGVVKVGFLGRLSTAKGLGDFLDVAELNGKNKKIEFIIAGVKWGRAHVDRINLLEKQGKVHFVGEVESAEQFFSDVHILLFPSTYGEGRPKVLMEAAAYGVPCIAYDIPGASDVIMDCGHGLTVPVDGGAESIFTCLIELVKDQKLYENLSRNGLSNVPKYYDEVKVAKALFDVVKR